MGFVSGLIGAAGGTNGTGFAGPSSANILNPTTVAQANTAYTGNQDALTQQQNFLNATQAQNGLQNQSNVYGQLQNVAAGQGPNPAQAMLNQATGQNIASQASLMAGQRGSGANAGLMARQAAQQGAATQQQAVGQGATMQAQQSLSALGQAGNMANTQAAQQAAATGANTSAQQNEQQQLLNSIAQQNNANVNMQSNVNTSNAGLAGNTMTGQQNLLGNITGGIGSALHLAAGGVIHAAGGYGDTTTDNLDTAMPPMQTAPVAAPMTPTIQPVSAPNKGPISNVGKHFSSTPSDKPLTGMAQTGNVIGKGIGTGIKALFGSDQNTTNAPIRNSDSGNMYGVQGANQAALASEQDNYGNGPEKYAKGGRAHKKVPALVSPGEIYLKPRDVKEVAKGKKSPLDGERIPGKPKVGGAKNSYANDIVPKTLSEGGIIIPRSITQGPNPHWEAMKFVHAVTKRSKK